MEKISTFIVGNCMEMCPKEEIQIREREKLVHLLELTPDSNKKSMVKSFSRSAAGKQIRADSLRPPEVLLRTVKHLLSDVIATDRLPWNQVYDFITDRLMAVRQDMIVQNISEAESITILQPIVRFHAFAAYKLCEESVANFDPVLNKNHLQECLKRLLNFYDSLHVKTVCNDYLGENRSDFEALYIVVNLGNEEALQRAFTVPKIYKSQMVSKAVQLSLSYRNGNFVRVCRLIKDLSPLLAAVSSLHLPEIRRRALQIMSSAYHSKNLHFPLKILSEILLYGNEEDLLADCKFYGVKTDTRCISFNKQDFTADRKTVCVTYEFFVNAKFQNLDVQDIVFGL